MAIVTSARNYLKTGIERTFKMLCISITPQKINKVQHNVDIIKQPLSQLIRES